jgi:oxygen-independent coproporphyrinogen-3 oxidase
LNYWEFGDYLGIGAGAHGKLSFRDRITRHERVKQLREYLQLDDTLACQRTIPAGELPFEFMLNALRLVEDSLRLSRSAPLFWRRSREN